MQLKKRVQYTNVQALKQPWRSVVPRSGSVSGLYDIQNHIKTVRGVGVMYHGNMAAQHKRPSCSVRTYDTGAPIDLAYRGTAFTLIPQQGALPTAQMLERDVSDWEVESFAEPMDTLYAHEMPLGADSGEAADPMGVNTASWDTDIYPSQQVVPEILPPPVSKGSMRTTVSKDPMHAKVQSPLPSSQELVENFHNDLHHMLGNSTPAPSVPSENNSTSAAPEPSPPAEDPHSVFDRMADQLNYANAFDLGPVELDKRFSRFEAELNREAPHPAVLENPIFEPITAEALENTEIIADLAEIDLASASAAKAETSQPDPVPPLDEAVPESDSETITSEADITNPSQDRS